MSHTRKPQPRWLPSGELVTSLAVWATAICIAAVFGWFLSDVLIRGLGGFEWQYLVQSPQDAGRSGGIAPILVSTALILAVCISVSLPISLGTAILLSELAGRGSRAGRMVRSSLDILAGVPSIVFGLFGHALFSVYLGMGYSILAGGLTLACMVLPLLTRATEQSLRDVPGEYRKTGAALGLSKASLVGVVLLPAAAPGILAGLVLSIGRALGETAALLFTSGYVDRMPESWFDSGRALTVHIYDLAMNVPGGEAKAYTAATLLLVLLVAINAGLGVSARWYQKRIRT